MSHIGIALLLIDYYYEKKQIAKKKRRKKKKKKSDKMARVRHTLFGINRKPVSLAQLAFVNARTARTERNHNGLENPWKRLHAN